MNLLHAARTGEYTATRDITNVAYPVSILSKIANQVVAHSFGFQEGPNGERNPGPVNTKLGQHLGALGVHELPWVIQEEIWEAVPERVKEIRRILDVPTTIVSQAGMPNGEYLSSVTMWDKAKEQADALKFKGGTWRPLTIAQAYHVERAATQGYNRGANPIVPPGLTKDFDPQSAQPWTTNASKWIKRESKVLGAMAISMLFGNRLFKDKV